MNNMQWLELEDALIRGAVTLERTSDGVKPWRLPYKELALFPEPLRPLAEMPTGVRISLISDTRAVEVRFKPDDQASPFDCRIDGELHASVSIQPGEGVCRFEGLPGGSKHIEVYVPHAKPVVLRQIGVEEGSAWSLPDARRPRWLTYGSSITQCKSVGSPTRTWPAVAAGKLGWELTSLGFSGNCHLEPMVARVIRDQPADIISMCVGINIMGSGSLSYRTFLPAIIGSVSTIREKHPETPILLISPIYCEYREHTPNKVDVTLTGMREQIRLAVDTFQAAGDSKIAYLDGLELFGAEYAHLLPDRLHPNEEGYRIMGERFSRLAEAMIADGRLQPPVVPQSTGR